MLKGKGLGRGLDALIGEEPPKDAVVSLRLGEIDPNRGQPRVRFDEDALRELADSIQSVGVLQPILVCREGARYTIVAGERRWRAARLAGLTEIPAIVRDWDEVKKLEAALIENLQRSDLNPIEEAAGIKSLMEQCGYTQEQASERVGMSRSAVANTLRLLTLPESILEMVRQGTLSAGHARALVAAPGDMREKLAHMAASLGWSVRQLEAACAAKRDPARETPARDPEFKRLERMARGAFGTSAEVKGGPDKGRLVLHYKSADELQRIWDVLEAMNQGEM